MFFYLKDFKLSKAGGHYWAEQSADINTLEWTPEGPRYQTLEEKRSEIHAIDSTWGKILTAYFDGKLTEETWAKFKEGLEA